MIAPSRIHCRPMNFALATHISLFPIRSVNKSSCMSRFNSSGIPNTYTNLCYRFIHHHHRSSLSHRMTHCPPPAATRSHHYQITSRSSRIPLRILSPRPILIVATFASGVRPTILLEIEHAKWHDLHVLLCTASSPLGVATSFQVLDCVCRAIARLQWVFFMCCGFGRSA